MSSNTPATTSATYRTVCRTSRLGTAFRISWPGPRAISAPAARDTTKMERVNSATLLRGLSPAARNSPGPIVDGLIESASPIEMTRMSSRIMSGIVAAGGGGRAPDGPATRTQSGEVQFLAVLAYRLFAGRTPPPDLHRCPAYRVTGRRVATRVPSTPAGEQSDHIGQP